MCATNCMNFYSSKNKIQRQYFHVCILDTLRSAHNSTPTLTITVVVKWHKNLTASHEISFINQPINTCGNKCTLLLPHRLKWRWHIYCIIICSWYSGKKNYWPLHTAVETFLDNLLTFTTNTCTYQMNYIYWYASELSCNRDCIKRIKEILFQHSLQTSTFFFYSNLLSKKWGHVFV
jgi:hypothetical protein